MSPAARLGGSIDRGPDDAAREDQARGVAGQETRPDDVGVVHILWCANDDSRIHSKLQAKFGDKVGALSEGVEPASVVETASIADVCQFLATEPGLELTSLMCLSATDDKTNLGVVYHLCSMTHKHKFTLKVVVSDRENPRVQRSRTSGHRELA